MVHRGNPRDPHYFGDRGRDHQRVRLEHVLRAVARPMGHETATCST